MQRVLSREAPKLMSREVDLAALLTQVAAADRQAFQQLYLATKAKLFGVVLRILHSPDDAAEVLQEVYLRVWQRAADYRPDKGAPMTWLIAIARNRALDWRRRMRIEVPLEDLPELEDVPEGADASPLQQALASADGRRLRACMEELQEVQQHCLVLAYQAGLTHQELAEHLNRPLGTIKSWLRRSLASLKECLAR